MNTDRMSEILQELKKPFHPSQIVWKPGSLNEDRTRALALAYADLRAYQNRLDEVCGMDWSVTYTPWSDRIVCHLTLFPSQGAAGITRSSTGEPDSQSERSEIAGTAAEAQAFKRACAMFGLGRYLYNLPSLWVEYDGKSRSFTERARARLDTIVNQHYRRFMESADATEAVEQAPADEPSPVEAKPQPLAETTPTEEAGNGEPPTEDGPSAPLRRQFEQLGRDLYGDQWDHVSRHNVERISDGKTSDSGQLTVEQMQKLIDGLKSLKRKRQRVQKAPEVNGKHEAVMA